MKATFGILFLVLVIFVTAYAETECQRHRKREQQTAGHIPGKLIPECDDNGDYKPFQCHGQAVGGGRFCQCWTKTGDIITSPSKKTKTCACHVKKHEAQSSRLIGKHVPQCDQSGHFKKAQCHELHYWCVNPVTGEATTPKTRGTCDKANCQ